MYNIFEQLMYSKGLTSYKVAKETGITQATLSRWKTGKVSPSIETLQIIASYFGVSVDYLLGNEQKEKPSSTNESLSSDNIKFALFKGEKDISDEMYQEVLDFAEYVKQKYARDKK